LAVPMIRASTFADLVSGRKRGIGAALLRCMLRISEVPYGLAVRWRNRRFDRGKREIHQVERPVISVGNLTVGGTGKTPLVAHLARWFRDEDVRVTLISRGYGAEYGAMNDEALELERRLPDVPHLQNPDRVEAARVAIDELACQLILLDDGFQHRRIYRDLDIVLIDATAPFGYGHLLPRGLLREPLSGLNRADVVILSRADMVAPDRRAEIRQRVERYAPDVPWVELAHRPQSLVSAGGVERPCDELAGKRVLAFSGIGNPTGFAHSLETCRYEVVDTRSFPDHHAYDREDVDSLIQWTGDHSDIDAIVCTAKDMVKIGVDQLGSLPLHALTIGVEILRGGEALDDLVEPLLTKARAAG